MWIITQNRKSIVKVKEVTAKGRYIEGVVGRTFFTEWSKVIGKYESSERVAEVILEIYEKIGRADHPNATFSMPDH